MFYADRIHTFKDAFFRDEYFRTGFVCWFRLYDFVDDEISVEVVLRFTLGVTVGVGKTDRDRRLRGACNAVSK